MSDQSTPTPEGAIPQDFGAAVIRTIAPYVTAAIVAWLVERGIDADPGQVSAAIVTIGGSLWYAFVRMLEQRYPKAGWLLGSPKTPTYTKPE